MRAAPYDTPSDVASEGGLVFLEGPGNTSVTMTPRAAFVTGRRLVDEAAQAQQTSGGLPSLRGH